MNTSELLSFILPQAELLQMSFFVLILAMFFGIVIATHLSAKDASWEKNWNNNTPDDRSDDLDIDHGSVTDLWHAVATKSEKLTEIMPSMLLVVGLLGTFLGLGLALNHASHILGQSNALSPAGAASSMQDLMGLLQGLGTKFKTSTWGITFFLLLKVWSSWFGFEEKRLAWVIRKVKTELEYRKGELQRAEENKQQALFAQINQAAGQIVQGFTQHSVQLSESQKALHQQTLQYFSKVVQAIHGDLTGIRATIQSNSLEVRQVLLQNTQIMHEDFASVNTIIQNDGAELKQALEQASKATLDTLLGFQNSMQHCNAEIKQVLTQSAQVIHEDLSSIKRAVQGNSNEIKQALDQSIQGVRKDLASINAATQVSSEAMSGFVGSTKAIIQDMSAASNKMADGARQVGIAGSSLVKAVDDFSTQFTQVLADVRTDLSAAINDMSNQAAHTLEQGSKELGNATLEISTALGVLSKDVTTTMNGVKDSIEKSLKIQQDGAILFRRSSDTLNENVTATTELVQKLGEDIRSGLQAVSDSGRRMASIGKSLETIVPQMGDLLPALEPLKTLHTHYRPLLDESKALRTDLLKLDHRQELQSIEKMIERSLSAQQNLQTLVFEIQEMRKDLQVKFSSETPPDIAL